MRCDIPPNVENAVITSEPEELYLPESTVTYVCRNSYLMNEKRVFCQRGTSEKPPTCQGEVLVRDDNCLLKLQIRKCHIRKLF